jgi:mRNA-degrading endonuclease RelE of RelBE toxin-antitoxin system
MDRLEWTSKALKQLLKLPENTQAAIRASLHTMLAEWPNSRAIKALTNRNDYRLRVGRYRVLFLVLPDERVTVFRVMEVRKRDEHTY